MSVLKCEREGEGEGEGGRMRWREREMEVPVWHFQMEFPVSSPLTAGLEDPSGLVIVAPNQVTIHAVAAGVVSTP